MLGAGARITRSPTLSEAEGEGRRALHLAHLAHTHTCALGAFAKATLLPEQMRVSAVWVAVSR